MTTDHPAEIPADPDPAAPSAGDPSAPAVDDWAAERAAHQRRVLAEHPRVAAHLRARILDRVRDRPDDGVTADSMNTTLTRERRQLNRSGTMGWSDGNLIVGAVLDELIDSGQIHVMSDVCGKRRYIPGGVDRCSCCGRADPDTAPFGSRSPLQSTDPTPGVPASTPGADTAADPRPGT